MSKHTPGPWKWWDERSEPARPKKYDLCKLIGGDDYIISAYGGAGFDALGKTVEDRANARLIAAAPDLLQACKELRDQIEADHTHLMGDHEGLLDSPEIMDLVAKSTAAIAKAEGRS